MIFNKILLSMCIVFVLPPIRAQVCQYTGHVCIEDKDCCGGCCLNNLCTDATRHCWDYDHLCLLHPCNGEEVCKVYQAWDGSEPQVYCE